MTIQTPAAKTNRVIHIVLVAFLLIAFRVWHLGVMQRDEKLKEAQKPKLRTILLRADRGMVYDRFGIPLAENRIRYNAAIYYGQIAQIPTASWTSDCEGRRIRTFPRKEHIQELSRVLGKTLSLDPERIEDLIHSKASLLPHVPFLIKQGISESEYYRLRLLEKDWLGVHAEIASERHYPLGKTACHILGSLGSISSREYGAITGEIGVLQEAVLAFEQGGETALPAGYRSFDEVYARLYELKERAYTLNDRVGKWGIEGRFEEDLRGYWGLKTFEVDQKGKALRELPGGKAPIPGRDIVLTISSELQQFAEELLCQSEKDREGKSFGIDPVDKVRKSQKQPWIKGGAIAAIDPKTGEVLAFASHPRFNPNDFICPGKDAEVCRWLENERFLGAVWDGRDTLLRERRSGNKIKDDPQPMSWEFFLSQILPLEGPLAALFARADDLKIACQIQEDFEALLYFSKEKDPIALSEAISQKASPAWEDLRSHPEASLVLRKLEPHLGALTAKDKLFAIDLFRLAVASPRFSDALLLKIGSMKISAYFALRQAFHRFEEKTRRAAMEAFHAKEFSDWRKAHQKEFLAEKRKEEKEKKTYARPYIDYLDQKEKELFTAYWEENRIFEILKAIRIDKADADCEQIQKAIAPLSSELAAELFRTFRSYKNLDGSLLHRKEKTEKDLASSFYPQGGFGFSRSYAFQTGSTHGSIFKLIASYEALRQGQNHLSIIDEFGVDPNAPEGKNQVVAYTLNRTPFPRLYKGGRLPKSSSARIGQIDLIGAIEHSSNPYFSLLAGDYLKNPEDLNHAARLFGYGSKTGIDLPGESAGNLPNDLRTNRTGLYSFAIGQHTLLATPIQSALMLCALSNGGHLLKPKIVKEETGLAPSKQPFSQENRFVRKELDAIGIPFPLFTAVQSRTEFPLTEEAEVEVKQSIPLPASIRNPLFEGMDRSLWSGQGNARPSAIKMLLSNPLLMRDFLALEHQMIGKTSTAEFLHNPNMNPSSQARLYKHIWFGAVSFDSDPRAPAKVRWEHPELVVVVFLRFGDAGKESAPLAAQMIKKWREIKAKKNPPQENPVGERKELY